jgi:hypothetical protein
MGFTVAVPPVLRCRRLGGGAAAAGDWPLIGTLTSGRLWRQRQRLSGTPSRAQSRHTQR